jgi:hypothetical protein
MLGGRNLKETLTRGQRRVGMKPFSGYLENEGIIPDSRAALKRWVGNGSNTDSDEDASEEAGEDDSTRNPEVCKLAGNGR